MNEDLTVAELWGRLSPYSREVCGHVARLANGLGQSVFLVGGSVRDLLLGVTPADLDVVTEGDAFALAEVVAQALDGEVREPSQFLTAVVRLPDGRRLDVATARQETYPEPTKLPVVVPADIAADLRRRDFTVNAVAVRLAPAGIAELVDPCGGRADLRARVIRILHATSFVDDPTRLVRAARFSTRLGFSVEPCTLAAAREAAEAGLLARVTGPRVRQEVVKLLAEPKPAAVLDCLIAWDAVEQVLPEYRPHACAQAWLTRAGVACAALRRAHSEGSPLGPCRLGLLALQANTEAVVRRLDLAGEAAMTCRVVHRAASADLPPELTGHGGPSSSSLDRALRQAEFGSLMVYWLRGGGVVRRRLEQYAGGLCCSRDAVDGHDLEAAGVPAGPAMRIGLQAARDVRLDGSGGRPEQLAAALAAIEGWRRPPRRTRHRGSLGCLHHSETC
jgi:tRNA nucleotidyltransferase (CCA-adding enzyme)